MLTVKVNRKSPEALDIFSFELIDVGGRPLPAFSAGSHIDVHIRKGLTRQYSLANDPCESHRYLIGVLRDPQTRGGSQAMLDDIHEGDFLQISEPRNHFPLAQVTMRNLLLAGGIGITPILSMAEQLTTLSESFELHYCARSKERTAFRQRIRTSRFSDRVSFHFDDGPESQKADIPSLLSDADNDTHLYVCGPTGFLEYVIDIARKNGWSSDNIHYEYFAPAQNSGDAASFEIKLASSGRILTVGANQSALEALAANGVAIPVSCEQGICGTCVTRVLSGVVDHKDSYLTREEQARHDQFTPCCSRAKSGMLVLDL